MVVEAMEEAGAGEAEEEEEGEDGVATTEISY